MNRQPKVIWCSDEPAPPNVVAATRGWVFHTRRLSDPAADKPHDGLTVVYPNGQASDPAAMIRLLESLPATTGLCVFMLPRGESVAWSLINQDSGRCIGLDLATPAEQLAAKLETLARIEPMVRGLRSELAAAHHARAGAADAVASLNEEMQLAAKLQQDFLPQRLPEVPPAHFAALFSPASWLSGDIYDVTRLDERFIGFYVADAVGHGMPAALLTMFIKKALQTKRVSGNSYQIIPPDLSLRELNTSICQQNLSSCHFCTAIYAVLNTQTLQMTYCRAGHPEALLLGADGSIKILPCDGGLLGVFPDATFQARTVQLAAGDRVVFYSDGIEEALRTITAQPRLPMSDLLSPWAALPCDELIAELSTQIDAHAKASDDITVLGLEIRR
ncbi:MAG: PP2C family protein-serine/threonine phosphatase [Planctomycetaceae bacterium]|nr:serine/threonine-protein phosphatase [Planctomycetaceae bacterium]